jgi:hypothetical protein
MDQTKPFWASWTLWGAVSTFLGVLLPNMGLAVTPATVTAIFQSWQQVLDSILTFGGLALTVYGRVFATKELTLTRK